MTDAFKGATFLLSICAWASAVCGSTVSLGNNYPVIWCLISYLEELQTFTLECCCASLLLIKIKLN